MTFDAAQPIQPGKLDRDETFVVFFEGFIKNPSEGMIRTMMRDEYLWLDVYPELKEFEEKTMEEIYEETMFFHPEDLLKILSEGKLSDEDIEKSLELIMPYIILENSKITSFEYSLYNLLQENFVKKCYFYKEGTYYSNEINYLKSHYINSMEKISFIDDTNFPDFIKKVKPTSIFLTDSSFIFDYVLNQMTLEERDNITFFLLNTFDTIYYDEEFETFNYRTGFRESVEQINNEENFSIVPMFNNYIDKE